VDSPCPPTDQKVGGSSPSERAESPAQRMCATSSSAPEVTVLRSEGRSTTSPPGARPRKRPVPRDRDVDDLHDAWTSRRFGPLPSPVDPAYTATPCTSPKSRQLRARRNRRARLLRRHERSSVAQAPAKNGRFRFNAGRSNEAQSLWPWTDARRASTPATKTTGRFPMLSGFGVDFDIGSVSSS
jgi:hypothetical protein